jgi:hypothetical protein
MPLREDFARWRDDPMTQTVLGALKLAEDEQKNQWDAASWGGSVARAEDLERLRIELRTRADAYASLREMTWPDVATWLGIDPDEQ